ncbi:MAG: acetyl-CoA carboxylase biotin carboxyl carrier protein subunit [Candidatus Accumulibacter sp.]|jgi:glutaconyl-CoA decarboxylase|nr:acetyl-CoA carboxylase biotin carboxyl carrier protein subunit [Accumulibacter sp.]
MRRYNLNVNSTEFVVDVQETSGDQFEVSVGGQTYAVSLAGEQSVATAAAAAPAPAAAPAAAAPAPAAAPVAAPAPAVRKAPAGGGKGGSVKVPMPGTILEVNVKPGDKIERGQQVAILDAMKMKNKIGAPKAGTVADVHVAPGQTVAHGEVIVTFKED